MHASAQAGGSRRAPQELPADLTQLSLEELLDVEITPINVLGSHTHPRGQWMLGYRYMTMSMKDYLSGTDRVSRPQVLRRYNNLHTNMHMGMHMFELMHAPTERLTLMGMLHFRQMTMDHVDRAGARFGTESSGLGDTTLMALHTFVGDTHSRHRVLANAGVSFPTGSINQRDETPSNRRAKLEYPMQLGSGTFDLIPGITYLGEAAPWAWGAQAMATVRLGRNENNYRFGNQYRLSAWGVYRVTDWFAPSLRLDGLGWGNITGRDPELNPLANPESDPRRQGGRRLDLVVGTNFYAPKGKFKGHRLTLEGGVPIYQSLSGPQLETDWQVSVAWNYTFNK